MGKFDDDSSQSRLGRAGETLVSNFFVRKGMIVESSIDQYDSTKDMLVDGKKVEVKTQVPFVYRNAFTVKENQLTKCRNSDVVVFVSVPTKNKEHFSYGKVYSIRGCNMEYNRYTTKDGRNMILIPIKQDAMKTLFKMTDQEQRVLQSYSVSDWN